MEDWVEKATRQKRIAEGQSRRDFVKGALMLLGFWVGKKAIDSYADKKFDLNDPERFREYLKDKEDLVLARLTTRAWIMDGVILYKEPARILPEKRAEGLITTTVGGNTKLLTVKEEDRFPVDNAVVLLKKKDMSSQKIIEVEGEEYDLAASWLVLGEEGMAPQNISEEIGRSINKIAFANLTDIMYQENNDSSLRSNASANYFKTVK
jgi:hypothetical protein